MLRIFIVAFLYALLSMGGCMPKAETKIVDRPDVAPMELPAVGWTMTFTLKLEASEGADTVQEPTVFDCFLKVSASGTSADYCGFNIDVSGDAFSFTLQQPYYLYSWYYGWVEVTVEGAGDVDGAELFVKGDYAGGWYKFTYSIEHDIEMGVPQNPAPGFAPVPFRLPETPDDLVAFYSP